VKYLQVATRCVARGLLKHAVAASPKERADWALGCIFVSYAERMRAMSRPLESLPRWGLHGGFTLQTGLLYCSREFVLIAVLPSLAVIHLVFINSQRRGSLIAA
jgi:hypothetical protein